MRAIQAQDLIERVHEHAPTSLIVSDADGTLWSEDVGELLLTALLDDGGLSPEAEQATRNFLARYGVFSKKRGGDLGREVLKAFGAGQIAEREVCEWTAWVFAGWSSEKVSVFAKQVALRRPLTLHPEVMAALEPLSRRGHPIVVISASPVQIVAEAVLELPFPVASVLAATACQADGVLVPDVIRPIPYGAGKSDALRGYTSDLPAVLALGDSDFDLELLKSAIYSVCVRPKPSLIAKAHELACAWRLVHVVQLTRS